MYHRVFLRVLSLLWVMYWSPFVCAQDERLMIVSMLDQLESREFNRDEFDCDESERFLYPENNSNISDLANCLKSLHDGVRSHIFSHITQLKQAFQNREPLQKKIHICNVLNAFDDQRLKQAFSVYLGVLIASEKLDRSYEKLDRSYEELWYGRAYT